MIRNFKKFNESIVKWYGDEEHIIDQKENEYKFKVVIGDWSSDGHGKCDELVFKGNHPVEELRQAYKDSCRLTGVQFNHNQNYTGIEIDQKDFKKKWAERKKYVCTNYGDDKINAYAYEKLKEFDLNVGKFGERLDIKEFTEIILNFIKLSIPDFKWNEASFKRSELKNIPPLNGYWNKELNVQFGYGLYGD
jgi:hypothetical protein